MQTSAPPCVSPRPLGNWVVRSRAWIAILLLAPAGIGAALSPLHYSLDSWGGFAFQSVGWMLFLAGGGIRWWATLYIGGRKNVELVVEGPYSITRNPIYLGTFLLTLAVGVLLQSVVFLLAALVVSASYLAVTVASEELHLRARYGQDFNAYCRRVPRFFPKLDLFHTSAIVGLNPAGLYRELVRMSRWMWIPVICGLVAHLRSAAWWPHWFSLP